MSINKLRSTYGVTHLINGKYKDMRGNCFKCLTPLRVDYTSAMKTIVWTANNLEF